MRYVITNVILWGIAIAVTFAMTRDTEIFSTLGPLLAICMIGSVITMRRAAGGRR